MSEFNLVSPLFNRPVALREQSRDIAVGMLAEWASATRAGAFKAFATDKTAQNAWKPYDVVCGVAIVPIRGILIQRVGPWSWLAELMGISGYDQIRLLVMAALADEDVEAVVLAIDSPGGDVAGCFDLADTIYAGRSIKPIWAILDEAAYSAAYALASSASKIIVPRTGGTGSIGVIYMHVSIAQALEKGGFDVTLITKGDLKAEGSEFRALSKGAFARIQRDVNTVGALFDRTVARNRGVAIEDVTDTQAGTFLGAAGVDAGLADAVMAPDAAFRALLKELG